MKSTEKWLQNYIQLIHMYIHHDKCSCHLLVAVLGRDVVEGAGLKEEDVELTGDASTEDGESIQSAESKEDVELLR